MPTCEFTGKDCEMKGSNPDCIKDWMKENIEPGVLCVAIGCNHQGENVPCPHNCPVMERTYKIPESGAGNEIRNAKPHEVNSY